MAVTQTVPRNNYTGNGLVSNYPYNFKASKDVDVRVAVRDTDDVVTELILGVDFAITGVGSENGGLILLGAPLALGEQLVIFLDPDFVQEFRFSNQVNFYPERHEASFDLQTIYSQILKERWGRALTFSPFDVSISHELPALVADGILRVKSDKSGLYFSPPGEFIGPKGEQGNPWFIGQGDPNDVPSFSPTPNLGDLFVDENGDFWRYDGTVWALTGDSLALGDSATAVGYSQRYGESVNLTTLQDIVNYIFRFVYTAPSISLSSAGSTTIREKGTNTTAGTLTANVTKTTDPIASVAFYKNGTLLYSVPSPNPAGGTSTYNDTAAFSDNVTYRADVRDNGATGGPSTVSSAVTYNFVYPYYYGAGANSLTPSQIAALTKDVIASNANLTKTVTATAGQYTYFAYPASYGALTSILDVNGFEVLPSWTASTVNITGLDTSSQSYRVYKGNNSLAAGSYQFTFKR